MRGYLCWMLITVTMFLRCTDVLLHFVALHLSCCAWEFLFVLAVVVFVVSLFCGLFLFIGFKTSCQRTTVENKPAGKTLAHLQSCWLMCAVLLNKWKERKGNYTSLKGQAHCDSLFRVMPVKRTSHSRNQRILMLLAWKLLQTGSGLQTVPKQTDTS